MIGAGTLWAGADHQFFFCNSLREIPAPAHSLFMQWTHITDHDLERYYLGMVTKKAELAPVEEHILACPVCAERADEAQAYVDAIRAAAIILSEPE